MHEGARFAVSSAIGEQLTIADHLVPIGKRRYSRGEEQHPGYLKSRNQTRIVENGPYRYTGEYFNDAPYAAAVCLGSIHVSSLGKRYHIPAQDFVTTGWAKGKRTYEAKLRSIL